MIWGRIISLQPPTLTLRENWHCSSQLIRAGYCWDLDQSQSALAAMSQGESSSSSISGIVSGMSKLSLNPFTKFTGNPTFYQYKVRKIFRPKKNWQMDRYASCEPDFWLPPRTMLAVMENSSTTSRSRSLSVNVKDCNSDPTNNSVSTINSISTAAQIEVIK